MAANIVRGLAECASGRCTPEQFKHAIEYARMGDNLDIDDLDLIINAPDHLVAGVCYALMPKYIEISSVLEHPANAEDWIERSMGVNPGVEPYIPPTKDVFSILPEYAQDLNPNRKHS